MGNGFIVFHALHRFGISTALSTPQLVTMRLSGTRNSAQAQAALPPRILLSSRKSRENDSPLYRLLLAGSRGKINGI